MSTKFTKKSPQAGFDLVDSHSLALTQATESFRKKIVDWLLLKLSEDGFGELTASQLEFLGSLDCGPNHAAELARGLEISRQAVHKTVRELEKEGWLYTKPDEQMGNQRMIQFTTQGERMMSLARAHFLELDSRLIGHFGKDDLVRLNQLLDFDPFGAS